MEWQYRYCYCYWTAVIKDGLIHVGAGAGIVADSDPESEWLECKHKSKVFLDAMEMIL